MLLASVAPAHLVLMCCRLAAPRATSGGAIWPWSAFRARDWRTSGAEQSLARQGSPAVDVGLWKNGPLWPRGDRMDQGVATAFRLARPCRRTIASRTSDGC